jgi:hypothetical protein
MSILLDIVAMMWDPRAGRVGRSGIVFRWLIEGLGLRMATPFHLPGIRGLLAPFYVLTYHLKKSTFKVLVYMPVECHV